MTTIKSLKGISSEKKFQAFSEAFKDYEMQLNQQELLTMLTRRGFVPELSFAAFENNKIISFTFNGVGFFNGIKTAYDTGTGTIKEFRGKGFATKIFQHSIPFLKESGVTQYLLEVLQHNSKAISVYEKQGFKVAREFNYFTQKTEGIKIYSKTTNPEFRLQTIDFSDVEKRTFFFDFNPSWQNSFESISRKPEDFIFLGVLKKQELLGYCILEPNSGDITQIAVHKKHRRKGIGTLLLKEILKLNRHHSLKVINSEINCESMNGFLNANSISLRGTQFEMIKQF